MPPITLNRRRFLGCSAAAGLALTQGMAGEALADSSPIRLGVIGLGTRGTSLLRTALELPNTQIVAICDAESRHRHRGQGIVEKAKGQRPEAFERASQVLERPDIDAVLAALPCDLHTEVYGETIRAGKHLYAEKPLALTAECCDQLIAASESFPEVLVQVGFQRRSNPRFRAGVDLIRRGDLGPLVEGRAAWVSSNGPMNGHDDWLARRDRSGDWMVEQAVHVWDVFNWIAGGLPLKAYGQGRRDLFAGQQPGRDVTDHYSVQLEWPEGFQVSFLHSWVAPADDHFTGVSLQVMGTAGGFDFGSGALTFRDKARPRQSLFPGNQSDTRLALTDFFQGIRTKGVTSGPISLKEARDATLTALLVRKAVDERRVVTMDEILAEAKRV